MKNKGKPEIKNIHKILLAIGLAFIVIGILLQIFLIQKTRVNIAVLRSVIITFVGAIILYFACIKRYSSFLGWCFSYFGSYFFKKTHDNFHNYSFCCFNNYGSFVFIFLSKHYKRLFCFCCNKPIAFVYDNFWCCTFWVFFLCPIWKTTYKSGPHRR